MKLQLRKTLEKTSRVLVFQPKALQKKQADDFIIEFGSELAELKESFMASTKHKDRMQTPKTK